MTAEPIPVTRAVLNSIRNFTHSGKVWSLLAVAGPFVLFALHGSLFGNWIVDDAGISFVYARNLAGGFGLVSQPGMVPVEGFSNFAWVLILTPFFWLKWFDPILTPKIISLVLILGSFIFFNKAISKFSRYPIIGSAFVLTLLAMNPAFVIWSVSGLENPLNVFLITMLFWLVVRIQRGESQRQKLTVWAAIVCAVCALTRPDGILYASILPLVNIFRLVRKEINSRQFLKEILVYAVVFAVIFGGYEIFRIFYFGDILPNTFYAKINRQPFGWLEKTIYLLVLVAVNPYLFAIFIIFLVFSLIRKQLTSAFVPVLTFLLVSMLIYLVLPMDWMPELRFGTAFLLFFYLLLFMTGETLVNSFPGKIPVQLFAALYMVVFLATCGVSFYERSTQFTINPTVPFSKIAQEYGIYFNKISQDMGVKNGSILLPDLGGTLYYSDLRVYDLAGLTDRVIARNMGIHQDVFYGYVFEELKPTFIHTHGIWALQSNFYGDPRFRQDYTILQESVDEELLTRKNIIYISGDYVRKEALAP